MNIDIRNIEPEENGNRELQAARQETARLKEEIELLKQVDDLRNKKTMKMKVESDKQIDKMK